MTKQERKLMKIVMASKFEKAYMSGKIYLSNEGMKLVLQAKEGK